jgi:hypothetical protein
MIPDQTECSAASRHRAILNQGRTQSGALHPGAALSGIPTINVSGSLAHRRDRRLAQRMVGGDWAPIER